ncbi:hypothetical protein Goklo_014179 [Gossypium klotzschianum]|uniref:Uncharacterized protein n=1 Tax=Gossypium klotzschianum TaxID=34286 RepID=A0A7J8U6S5_9ROSI|nr:hypothetical protein [Gossypium klotzschianum]
MVVIEGNEISNARDTTHERITPEETECLDDIKVSLKGQGNLFYHRKHLDLTVRVVSRLRNITKQRSRKLFLTC